MIVFCHRRTDALVVLPHPAVFVVEYALVMLIDSVDFAVAVADRLLGGSLVGAIYPINFLIVAADSLIELVLLLTKQAVKLRLRHTAGHGPSFELCG